MVNRRPVEIAGKFTTPPLLALAGGGFCGQGGRVQPFGRLRMSGEVEACHCERSVAISSP